MRTTLQDQITGNESPAIDLNGVVLGLGGQFKPVTFFVIGEGTLSAGKISIEEAHEDDYDGAWSLIQEVNLDTLTGGGVKAVHLTSAANYRAVRARLSTATTGGGTVSVIADIA